MYLNFYKRDLEVAVALPIYAIKVNVYENINKEKPLDILSRTVLELIKIYKEADVKKIAKMLGFEGKYERAIVYSIADLKKAQIIKLDERNKLIEEKEIHVKVNSYYAIYDSMNKNILECLIKEDTFNSIKFYKNEFLKSENIYKFNEDRKPHEQIVSKEIKKLINKINVYNESKNEFDYMEEENQYNEFDDINRENTSEILKELEKSIIPQDFIELESVSNHMEFEKLELLIKVVKDKSGNLRFQWPFNNDYQSIYVEKYIMNYFDENSKEYKVLSNKIDNDDINYIMEVKSNIAKEISYYKKYKLSKERYDDLEKILFYREIIKLSGDFYKSIESPIGAFDKIIKSKFKDVTDKLGVCKKHKNFIVMDYFKNYSYNNVLISSIKNRRIKPFYREKKLNYLIGESSISDYLTMIIIAPYVLKKRNEEIIRFQKSLLNDNRILDFINDIWLYRNTTTHSVEKGKYYDEKYDMTVKQKERIEEDINDYIVELEYFLEEFLKLEEATGE